MRVRSDGKSSEYFGGYLRWWREAKGLSQDDAAPMLGIALKNAGANLSLIEQGKRPFSTDMLLKLSDAYDVPIDEVLRRAYWPQMILLPLVAIIDPKQLSKDLIEEIEKGFRENERQSLTLHIKELLSERS